jgi:SAM-dependent methyltransferase
MVSKDIYNTFHLKHIPQEKIFEIIKKMDRTKDECLLRKSGISERHLQTNTPIWNDRKKYFVEDRFVVVNEVMSSIFNFSQLRLRVLDAGCGYGEYMAIMRGLGHETYGINGLHYVDDFLYANKLLNLNVIQANLLKPLPFADDSFDCVFCCGVLTLKGFVGKIQEVLNEFNRISSRFICLRLHSKMFNEHKINNIKELAPKNSEVLKFSSQDLVYEKRA